jgi:hypothetical protein
MVGEQLTESLIGEGDEIARRHRPNHRGADPAIEQGDLAERVAGAEARDQPFGTEGVPVVDLEPPADHCEHLRRRFALIEDHLACRRGEPAQFPLVLVHPLRRHPMEHLQGEHLSHERFLHRILLQLWRRT